MTTFVLVHGAYHGAWCWSRLVPLLEDAGHQVTAPDLPGHGADPTPPAQVTLATYAGRIAEVVSGVDGHLTLVGHSMAGAVVSTVVEMMPDRIDQMIYLTAYIPPNGETVAQMVRADTQIDIPIERLDRDGVPYLRITPEVMHRHFYQDAEDTDFQWAVAQTQDQAVAPFAGVLNVTEANFGRVPKAYIHCRYDRAIGLSLQRRMARGAGCDPEVYLKSGHSPFLTQPAALCQTLLGLTEG